MKLGQRLLKLFSPRAEQARMEMRAARCHAEAVAEDLNRTMILHGDKLVEKLRNRVPPSKVNGKPKASS